MPRNRAQRQEGWLARTQRCAVDVELNGAKESGLHPATDVTLVPHAEALFLKSIAPRLDRGETQARIAYKACLDRLSTGGHPILADLEEYVPNGYRLHAIATTGPCLDKNYTAIVGYPTSTIRAYRFMETRSNHAKKVRIIDNSDLKFEERYEPDHVGRGSLASARAASWHIPCSLVPFERSLL
ncbi:MAG: hypothetical protein ACM37Z_03180 [Deltaproteobacteria bacterium]